MPTKARRAKAKAQTQPKKATSMDRYVKNQGSAQEIADQAMTPEEASVVMDTVQPVVESPPSPVRDVADPTDIQAALAIMQRPEVQAKLATVVAKIRSDYTYCNNLRVRLTVFENGDGGPLAQLLDAIQQGA